MIATILIPTVGILGIVLGIILVLLAIVFMSVKQKSRKGAATALLVLGVIALLYGLFSAFPSSSNLTSTTTSAAGGNASYQECSIADLYINSTNSSSVFCPNTLASARLTGVSGQNATFTVLYGGHVLNSSVVLSTSSSVSSIYYFAYGTQSFSLQLLGILNATSTHETGAGVQINVKR